MKITLLRHAEVQEQYKGCYNGHIDMGLSAHGYAEAKQLSQKMQDANFDALYCSDLLRAKETLKQFDLSIKANYTRKLREKSWGRHEGLSYEEIVKNENIQYENFSQWLEALDGEKIESYIQNVKDFFYNEILTLGYENILIVTHSGFIKTLLHIINEDTLENNFSTNIPYLSTIEIVNYENSLRVL